MCLEKAGMHGVQRRGTDAACFPKGWLTVCTGSCCGACHHPLPRNRAGKLRRTTVRPAHSRHSRRRRRRFLCSEVPMRRSSSIRMHSCVWYVMLKRTSV